MIGLQNATIEALYTLEETIAKEVLSMLLAVCLCCGLLAGCGNGLVEEGSLSGRTLYFIYQGASPEKWMMEAGEYTMKRFAGLYGMGYAGMATNRSEAEKLSEKLG